MRRYTKELQPQVGDFVHAAGHEGTVKSINLRTRPGGTFERFLTLSVGKLGATLTVSELEAQLLKRPAPTAVRISSRVVVTLEQAGLEKKRVELVVRSAVDGSTISYDELEKAVEEVLGEDERIRREASEGAKRTG